MGRARAFTSAARTVVPRVIQSTRAFNLPTTCNKKASFAVPAPVVHSRARQLSLLVARATDDDEDYDAELDAMDRMDKSIAALQNELAGIRAGRAMPTMLSTVVVEYYGAPTPLQNLATVATPDAGTLVVKPFDKGTLKIVEDAIIDAGLGFNPSNDGEIIRINIPQLTEERRKELVKVVSAEGEASKVAVRNVRRDVLKKVDKLDLPEDDLLSMQDEVQKLTDSYTKKIQEMVEKKSKELSKV